MTHISSKNIDTINYTQAQEQLTAVIANLKISGATNLINELFTEAERVMLIKRFAAIFMFQQNYSSYRVSQTVGLSTSTSSILYQNYTKGNYNKLLSSITKNQKSEFLNIVEDFMLSKISTKARIRLVKRVLR